MRVLNEGGATYQKIEDIFETMESLGVTLTLNTDLAIFEVHDYQIQIINQDHQPILQLPPSEKWMGKILNPITG